MIINIHAISVSLAKKQFSARGQLLVELLIALGLSAILLPAIITGMVSSRDGRPQRLQRIEAVNILRETQEAVRNVRELGWNQFAQLAINEPYHPLIVGSSWTLAPGLETLNGFTRQVVISDVARDTLGAIVASGGSVDPSSKKITITVSWTLPYASSIDAVSYITRHENLEYIQTTQADFNAGTKSGVDVVATNGSPTDGQVVLATGGGAGDWCIPSESITQDLPRSGVANAISAIEGRIFTGTGDNASGVSFADVNLTTNVDPPQVISSKTLDGYKTNAVFGENNYAYLGTDNNAKEFVIIDLNQYSDPPTNSKYKEVGAINLPVQGNGNSIYVTSNTAYVTGDNKFYIYDITNKASPVLKNSPALTLSGTGNKVVIVGTNAYIVTSATTSQLQIIDVATPASPSISEQISLPGQGGRDLFVNQTATVAYVATANSAAQKELFVIDVDKNSATYKQVKGSYDSNGMDPKGVTVVTGNRAILVGSGGTDQYQVIRLTDLGQCAGLQYSTGINGVASVLQINGYAYSYIITGDANAELKIILGGGGTGSNFVSSGTFTSSYFDTTAVGLSQSAFNRYNVTFNQPSQTSIRFQFAVANAVDNSCEGAAYSFVGWDPENPSGTFFTGTEGAILPGIYGNGAYQNPGRCFKYKMYIDTDDSTQTPELYDVSINYSP